MPTIADASEVMHPGGFPGLKRLGDEARAPGLRAEKNLLLASLRDEVRRRHSSSPGTPGTLVSVAKSPRSAHPQNSRHHSGRHTPATNRECNIAGPIRFLQHLKGSSIEIAPKRLVRQ
jgi:hypothetical protein